MRVPVRLCLVGFLGCALVSTFAESASIPITILHTSDLHARLRSDDQGRGGFAQLAAVIAEEKTLAANVLVLDGGDLVQGTPVSTLFRGTPIFEVASLMGLDAGILGNHDFDYGWRQIQEFQNAATFPLLCANVFYGDTPLGDAPSTVFVRQGVRIAVIGLTTTRLPKLSFPEHIAGLRIESIIDSARRELELQRGKADLFIALGHLELEEGESLLTALPDLTAVIAGHVHSGRPPKRLGRGIVVGVNAYGRALGRLRLTWSGAAHSVVSMDWEKIPIERVTPDPRVAQVIDEWERKADQVVDVEIGLSQRELSGVELKELTERALREELGVDFAFQNRGGIRDILPKGRILARHIWNVHPFDNKVVIARLKGSEIPAIIRSSRELDPAKVYTLACSDFVAANQHEMSTQGLQFAPGPDLRVRDCVINWIKKQKVIP